MSHHAEPSTAPSPAGAGNEIDFDTPALAGWQHFTKFLTWNVAATLFTLLFIGAVTIWR